MWGAIIGDLAGSIYEYNQIKKVKEIKNIKITNQTLHLILKQLSLQDSPNG